MGTKIIVIRQNAHKYSISAMCKCLNIARSTYYYETIGKPDERDLETKISLIFRENYDVYGTKKIKKELQKLDCQIFRRRIGRIMNKIGLVSKYTVDNLNRINKNIMKNLLPDRLPMPSWSVM